MNKTFGVVLICIGILICLAEFLQISNVIKVSSGNDNVSYKLGYISMFILLVILGIYLIRKGQKLLKGASEEKETDTHQ